MHFPFLEENHSSFYGAQAHKKPLAPLCQMDDDDRREFWASLALRHCRKIGVRTRARLLNYFGSAYQAVYNRKSWRDVSVNKDCSLEFGSERWRVPAKREWDEAVKSRASIILWNSSQYPSRLREISDPPGFLYALGDTELLESPAIAMVGSRKASDYSLKTAWSLSKSLASKGISVISGMALGIDRYVHRAALEGVGKSIGILGTGINLNYPALNQDIYEKMILEGLLLSEFPPNTPPVGVNFPIRNRLISGLSLGVVVIEAAAKSGSLITARYALEQNREVFAVPGQALNSRSLGCQNLIRQGARPVFCVDDILRDLADLLKSFESLLSPEETCQKQRAYPEPAVEIHVSDREAEDNKNFKGREIAQKCGDDELSARILSCLSRTSMHIEELAEELGIGMSDLNSRLVLLEMLGRVRRVPGARFESI